VLFRPPSFHSVQPIRRRSRERSTIPNPPISGTPEDPASICHIRTDFCPSTWTIRVLDREVRNMSKHPLASGLRSDPVLEPRRGDWAGPKKPPAKPEAQKLKPVLHTERCRTWPLPLQARCQPERLAPKHLRLRPSSVDLPESRSRRRSGSAEIIRSHLDDKATQVGVSEQR
jgi:hypothetical protein